MFYFVDFSPVALSSLTIFPAKPTLLLIPLNELIIWLIVVSIWMFYAGVLYIFHTASFANIWNTAVITI